jgi:hypothetical protein
MPDKDTVKQERIEAMKKNKRTWHYLKENEPDEEERLRKYYLFAEDVEVCRFDCRYVECQRCINLPCYK